MRQPYTDPTAFLLSLGDPRKIRDPNTSRGWADYIKKFGFSLNDVPTLLQLLKDPTIKAANTNDPLVWADVHAWRALGQLRAVEAIPDLIAFFDYENEYEIEDWAMEEIPRVLGKIGIDAVKPLDNYLNTPSKGCWSIAAAADALEHIGTEHPEAREVCVAALSNRLERYTENKDINNGLLICNLVHLNALESLDLIRKAFQAETVDIDVIGDLEDVEIRLGVRQERSTPKPQHHLCGSHCFHDNEHHIRKSPKIGRNDPCPCGSGKKYKKCCLE